MEQILAAAAGAFFLSVWMDSLLIRRRYARIGYLIGLLPILIFGAWYLIPPLTCHSDNGLACEWAGIGVVILGGLTLFMLIIYSLIAYGNTRAFNAEYRHVADPVPLRHAFGVYLRTIVLLLVFSIAGGLTAKQVHDLVRTGIFVTWRSLGTPPDMGPLPGERAVTIQSYDLKDIQILTNRNRPL